MFISIDIGGSKTRVASSLDCISIHKSLKKPTPPDLPALVGDLNSMIEDVCESKKIEQICIGIPGIVDKNSNLIRKAPNIKFLDNIHIGQVLPGFDESIVHVWNDMALSAMTEACIGAGAGYNNVAYISISTGVGGIKIQDKKINTSQTVSEPGHTIISLDGKDLEAFISGSSFRNNYGVSPDQCDDPKIWTDYTKYIYIGVINIMSMWDPDAIIFGGGVANRFDEFVKSDLVNRLSRQDFFRVPAIEVSKFGDDSGLLGGFILIDQCKKRN